MAKSGRHPGFELKLPSEWQEQTVYSFVGPQVDGVYHSITINLDCQVGKQTLRQFAQTRMEQTIAARPDAKTLKAEERELASGLTVFEFAYGTSPAPQQTDVHKQTYLVSGGIGYTITASFSKKTAKTVGRQVEKIIESFAPSE